MGGAAAAGQPDIGTSRSRRRSTRTCRCAGATWSAWASTGTGWAGLRGGAAGAGGRGAGRVGGTGYADAPVGRLSGGEQQRLRVAQALVGDPGCCSATSRCSPSTWPTRHGHRLIDERRRAAGTAVLFVTHEINPILPLVDRVLYLVDGRFRVGPPDEVMTSAVLSALYRTRVDVLRVRDRLVVVGEDGADVATARRDEG